MQWFEKNPKKVKNIIHGLNDKYGNFDFTKSSRVLYKKEFAQHLNSFKYSNKKIIIVGGNDGHEINYLATKPKEVFIVDLAKKALKKVRGNNIYPIQASAENLPFIDSYFDFYLAFRVLYSDHVDLKTCLKQAYRVLSKKGNLIVSIPNGFLVKDKIKNGMFNYNKNKIDEQLPSKYLDKSIKILKKLQFQKIKFNSLPGEIIISAVKD